MLPKGLEPSPRERHGPKPCASANSATGAKKIGRRQLFYVGSALCAAMVAARSAPPTNFEIPWHKFNRRGVSANFITRPIGNGN